MPREDLARAYEGFLGLPVPIVLAALWLAGAALGVAGVVAAHEIGSELGRALMRSAGGVP